jgi:hypothetical protein
VPNIKWKMNPYLSMGSRELNDLMFVKICTREVPSQLGLLRFGL